MPGVSKPSWPRCASRERICLIGPWTTTHNRSVVTIAGKPEAVIESAVQGAGKASSLST